jgi:arylsulfatase A-like enzyme
MAVEEGRAETDVVRAKMIEQDEHVGAILKKLDEFGVADNTIVVYSTDNGFELLFWPDGLFAIPWREGNDVGRWRPRAVFGSLARTYQAGHGIERHTEP